MTYLYKERYGSGHIDNGLLMLTLDANLTDFIEEKIKTLKCHEDTRAYITSIFGKYKFANFDYSRESITILYMNAKAAQNFAAFQNIGDWLFFSETLFPEHLRHASNEYYQSIARLSYYSCYRLIEKKWVLFQELSDNYPYLVESAHSALKVMNGNRFHP